jgi:hypothetical protein
MTDPAAQHTFFRVEYTLGWDPRGRYYRSVMADPPVTLDEALSTALRHLTDDAANERWVRLDDACLVRAGDVSAFRVVPVRESSDDQAINFVVAAEESEGPGSLLSRERG